MKHLKKLLAVLLAVTLLYGIFAIVGFADELEEEPPAIVAQDEAPLLISQDDELTDEEKAEAIQIAQPLLDYVHRINNFQGSDWFALVYIPLSIIICGGLASLIGILTTPAKLIGWGFFMDFIASSIIFALMYPDVKSNFFLRGDAPKDTAELDTLKAKYGLSYMVYPTTSSWLMTSGSFKTDDLNNLYLKGTLEDFVAEALEAYRSYVHANYQDRVIDIIENVDDDGFPDWGWWVVGIGGGLGGLGILCIIAAAVVGTAIAVIAAVGGLLWWQLA